MNPFDLIGVIVKYARGAAGTTKRDALKAAQALLNMGLDQVIDMLAPAGNIQAICAGLEDFDGDALAKLAELYDADCASPTQSVIDWATLIPIVIKAIQFLLSLKKS